MNLKLLNISPIDGRYANKTSELAPYFSEYGLINYRVRVEIEYLIFLSTLDLDNFENFSPEEIKSLKYIYLEFEEADAQKIKDIEQVTNHDVKAVEYFVKEKIKSLKLDKVEEFVHFGLTSQDINNTAIPLLLKEYTENEFLPELNKTIEQIEASAQQWLDIPMLAKTHGQPASPTILGKEIMVFVERIKKQMNYLKEIDFSAKFGGATGNLNAHYFVYPKIDWHKKASHFVNDILGLSRSYPTTQIEHYDQLANYCQCVERINTIFVDLCRDIWTYISMDYFTQKTVANEVGSSAMPHKVNPIDFENAEGNLGFANAMLQHFASKLPISRLQRDLTDSTVLRNIGLPFAHITVSLKSLQKGWSKIQISKKSILKDLQSQPLVIAEAIQSYLRSIQFDKPYEALKKLTRENQKISLIEIYAFIEQLPIESVHKDYLKTLTPENYIGKY